MFVAFLFELIRIDMKAKEAFIFTKNDVIRSEEFAAPVPKTAWMNVFCSKSIKQNIKYTRIYTNAKNYFLVPIDLGVVWSGHVRSGVQLEISHPAAGGFLWINCGMQHN